jgi:hypothetical protein
MALTIKFNAKNYRQKDRHNSLSEPINALSKKVKSIKKLKQNNEKLLIFLNKTQ